MNPELERLFAQLGVPTYLWTNKMTFDRVFPALAKALEEGGLEGFRNWSSNTAPDIPPELQARQDASFIPTGSLTNALDSALAFEAINQPSQRLMALPDATAVNPPTPGPRTPDWEQMQRRREGLPPTPPEPRQDDPDLLEKIIGLGGLGALGSALAGGAGSVGAAAGSAIASALGVAAPVVAGGLGMAGKLGLASIPLVTTQVPRFLEALSPFHPLAVNSIMNPGATDAVWGQMMLMQPEEFLRMAGGGMNLSGTDMGDRAHLLSLIRSGYENVLDVPTMLVDRISPYRFFHEAKQLAQRTGQAFSPEQLSALERVFPIRGSEEALPFEQWGPKDLVDLYLSMPDKVIEVSGRKIAALASELGWGDLPVRVGHTQGLTPQAAQDMIIDMASSGSSMEPWQVESLLEGGMLPFNRSTVFPYPHSGAFPLDLLPAPTQNLNWDDYMKAEQELETLFREKTETPFNSEASRWASKDYYDRWHEIDRMFEEGFEWPDEYEQDMIERIMQRNTTRARTRPGRVSEPGLFEQMLDIAIPGFKRLARDIIR